MPVKKTRETQGKQLNAEFRKDLARHAKRGLPKVVKFLEKVIDGKYLEDQYDPKGGEIIQKRPSAATLVQATNSWCKIVLDKLVADRKEVKTSDEGYGVTEAIKDISKGKAAAKKAVGGGNVVPFPKGKQED